MSAIVLEKKPTTVLVVAAVLRDPQGRLLLQHRPAHKAHGGLWEFPGGKVEIEETPRLALCREIAEELGLALDPDNLQPIGFAESGSDPAGRTLVLMLYSALLWQGQPRGLDGQEWGWFTVDEAAALPLPPMDRALLGQLVLTD
jgi:8-oxo-dGTP diphosphatase